MMTAPDWMLPWAKLGRGKDKIYPTDAHPVMCHLLDVAYVALVLWSDCLAGSVRNQWARVLGLSEEDTGRWIAFWAGCHDIGKACPGFQNLDQGGNAKQALERAGFRVGHASRVRHDYVSASLLPDLWRKTNLFPSSDVRLSKCLAAVIGGHHGIIPRAKDFRPSRMTLSEIGTGRWDELRRVIVARLAGTLHIADCDVPATPSGADQSFYLFLAGLISVADWIGSNTAFFQPRGFPPDWTTYVSQSPTRAQQAVAALGWSGWRAEETNALDFRAMFGFASPRPLQCAVERLVNGLNGPALLLVEAPMGEGKTEAAFYASDRHTHERGGRGMYVALPTTATSNGMFSRVADFIARRYPDPGQRVNLQLLHGRTFLSERFLRLKERGQLAVQNVGQEDDDSDVNGGGVVAEEWFAKDKRQGMLAPFAVGTVDQALLSVLQTRFGFVRLFGLAGKTVILDEVHAYDAYTSTILGRLLAWLNAIGSHVVMLSATLPRKTRHRLLAEYLHFDPDHQLAVSSEDDIKPYPRVSVACPVSKRVAVEHFPADPQRRLTIAIKPVQAKELAERLCEVLATGGTATIICNTVNQAQYWFHELEGRLGQFGIVVELFHARFPLGDRQKIEDHVLEVYGKGHKDDIRPARVLVATQVVEQSLDLDFDLMVTEYAPVDLILQRVGRLHRHDRARPKQFLGQPELWLIRPQNWTGDVPVFGAFEDRGRGGVYSRYVLLKTFLALRNRSAIGLPDDIEETVEEVYREGPTESVDADWSVALAESRATYEEQQRASRANAKEVLVRVPASDSLLRQTSRDLPEEDDPQTADSRVAKTREGDPTVQVVLLYRVANGLSLTACGTPIDLNRPPREVEVREIVERSVSLSHQAWVNHFAMRDVPSGWQHCSALRFHRVAELDSDGLYRAEPGSLRYDQSIGIELRRGYG